jgi:hypothetical protein
MFYVYDIPLFLETVLDQVSAVPLERPPTSKRGKANELKGLGVNLVLNINEPRRTRSQSRSLESPPNVSGNVPPATSVTRADGDQDINMLDWVHEGSFIQP